MKKYNLIARLAVAVSIIFTFNACLDEEDPLQGPLMLDLIEQESELSTFFAALNRTNLAEVVANSNSITIFAPDNDAFDDFLDDANLTSLDQIADSTLEALLFYHMQSGAIQAAQIRNGYFNSLVNIGPGGAPLTVLYLSDGQGGVNINNVANVSRRDLESQQGFLHVLDAVTPLPNLMDFVRQNENFSEMVDAIEAASLEDELSTGTYTLFSALNEGFERYYEKLEGVDELEDIPTAAIRELVRYHMIDGNLRSNELTSGFLQTVNGDSLLLFGTGTNLSINGTTGLITGDIQGTNGVLHVTSDVLENL